MSQDLKLTYGDDIPTLVRKAKAILSQKPKRSPEYKEAEKFLKGLKDDPKKEKASKKKRAAKNDESSDTDTEVEESSESSGSDTSTDDEDAGGRAGGSTGASKKASGFRGAKKSGGPSTSKRAKQLVELEEEDVVFSDNDNSQKKYLRGTAKTIQKGKKIPVDGEMKVYFFAATSDALLPKRATSKAAGFDLASIDYKKIRPNHSAVIDTALKVILPPGCYGRIASRSGLASEKQIIVSGGVIDNDYTGTIKVILLNCGTRSFRVHPGDRIAQMIIEKYFEGDAEQVDGPTMDAVYTQRGEKGFGSTGMSGAL